MDFRPIWLWIVVGCQVFIVGYLGFIAWSEKYKCCSVFFLRCMVKHMYRRNWIHQRIVQYCRLKPFWNGLCMACWVLYVVYFGFQHQLSIISTISRSYQWRSPRDCIHYLFPKYRFLCTCLAMCKSSYILRSNATMVDVAFSPISRPVQQNPSSPP